MYDGCYFSTRIQLCLVSLLLFSACTNHQSPIRISGQTSAIDQLPTSQTTAPPPPPTECAIVQATLTLVSPSSGDTIQVGDDVVFGVSASGCAKFNLVQSDGTQTTFSASAQYHVKYSKAGPVTETATVNALPSQGFQTPIPISYGPFTVVDSANPLTCVVTPQQSAYNVPVNPDFELLESFPSVQFFVQAEQPSVIVGIADVSSTIEPHFMMPAPTTFPVEARLTSFGRRLIEFQIQDPNNPKRRGYCGAYVQVDPKIIAPPLPPPPTCTLTASAGKIYTGDPLTLNLKVNGKASSAHVGEVDIDVNGSVTLHPVTSGQAIAFVAGPGGAGTCSVSYQVAPRKKTCWIGMRERKNAPTYQKGRVFIGDLPSDFEQKLRKWVNDSNCTGSCGKTHDDYYDQNLKPYERFANDTFRTSASKTFTYLSYTYDLFTGSDVGSIDCPLVTKTFSPLIIDLGQSGIALLPPRQGPLFDLEGSGIKAHYSWPADPSTAVFLVYDKNQNGNIDGVDELFGDNTVGPDGKKALNGFDALRKYDSNNDGKISASDKIFSKLRLWSDLNQNGIVDHNELYALADKQIAYIDLGYQSARERIDVYGNEIGERSVVKLKNGQLLTIFDVWFAAGN